jgi:DNA-binding transcriptional MerR regulator
MRNKPKPKGVPPRDPWRGMSPKKLFYKIGEVCEIADIPPHVLRYWETEFPSLKPVKNSAGQRVFRPKDIDLVLTIRRLLYEEGYTISGARKKIRESATQIPEPEPPPPSKPKPAEAAPRPGKPEGRGKAPAGVTLFPDTGVVREIRAELSEILNLLEKHTGD